MFKQKILSFRHQNKIIRNPISHHFASRKLRNCEMIGVSNTPGDLAEMASGLWIWNSKVGLGNPLNLTKAQSKIFPHVVFCGIGPPSLSERTYFLIHTSPCLQVILACASTDTSPKKVLRYCHWTTNPEMFGTRCGSSNTKGRVSNVLSYY